MHWRRPGDARKRGRAVEDRGAAHRTRIAPTSGPVSVQGPCPSAVARSGPGYTNDRHEAEAEGYQIRSEPSRRQQLTVEKDFLAKAFGR